MSKLEVPEIKKLILEQREIIAELLSPRERDIIYWYTKLNGDTMPEWFNVSKKEFAEGLGVTPERITQILNKTKRKLKRKFNKLGLYSSIENANMDYDYIYAYLLGFFRGKL